jgi:hypothetical protein
MAKATTTTLHVCHQESYEQLTEERSMIEISWPGTSGPKGHPVDPLLGTHCVQNQVTPTRSPTQGNAVRW